MRTSSPPIPTASGPSPDHSCPVARRRTTRPYCFTHECAHCGILYSTQAAQATQGSYLRCNFQSLRLIRPTRQ